MSRNHVSGGEWLTYGLIFWVCAIARFCFKTPLRAIVSGSLLLFWLGSSGFVSVNGVNKGTGDPETRAASEAYTACRRENQNREVLSFGTAPTDKCQDEAARFKEAFKKYDR